MCEAKLLVSISTIDNRMLLPAGTVLTREVMENLAQAGREEYFESRPILEYGTVRQDFIHFISNPPYQVIFADQEQTEAVLKTMAGVSLPLPVLQSLDYFKQHDFHTYRHMLMIFGLSLLLSWDLIPEDEDSHHRALASPTHDIGKAAVPLDTLIKPEPLTREEREILKQHTLAGYVLLTYYLGDCDALAVRVARDHHEKRNNSGYPCMIRQADPMVEIVSACDVYDALISPRPYRPTSYDNRTALEEITSMAEKGEVGWEVVQALVAVNRIDKPHYSAFTVSTEKRGTPPPNNSYGIIADEEKPAVVSVEEDSEESGLEATG